MNQNQRKELERAQALIAEARIAIDTIAEEQQEKYDNLNEGMQAMEKMQKLQEEADYLYEIVSELYAQEDSIISALEGNI